MHVSDDSNERRPRRGAMVLLVPVLLLAVVAIASSGHVPVGSGDSRRPSDQVADTVVSLILVLVLAGGAGIFYVYYLQRTNSHERQRRGLAGGSRRSLVAVIACLLLVLAFSVRAAIDSRRHHGAPSVGGARAPANHRDTEGGTYTPRFATVPVAVILGAAGMAGIAAYLSYRAGRRIRRPPFEPSLVLTLADVLGETLDDLRAEPDPRVAVIAAYARLERTLTAFGVPRRESDAPAEYLQRILIDLDVGAHHASRLTQLFEHAKFSPHDVRPELKDEAIELLEAIRADLQAAETARLATLPLTPVAPRPA
jgi:hypothetical protein